MKSLIFLLCFITVQISSCSQTTKEEKGNKSQYVDGKISNTKEILRKINEIENNWRTILPVGIDRKTEIYIVKNRFEKIQKFMMLDEESDKFIHFKFNLNLIKTYNSFYLNIDNKILFHHKPEFKFNEDGYNMLFLSDGQHNYNLDSVYNADKKIHSSFSEDGNILLINTLNSLSDYYNEEQDNRTLVVDLEEFKKNKVIKKEYIPCNKCSHSYKRGDKLFFNVGRLDGYDGYTNRDIYVAPWGSIKDTTKLASNISILDVTPDGKYILGNRFFDRQKNTLVILEVATKKYQMLIGRDYYKYVSKFFYSRQEKKFAFLSGSNLVYIDFPKEYPFDTLNWRNEEIPNFTEKEFWKQFEHEPLQE